MPGPYDFTIIGSSPLSGLLAGLLAHDHGRRVLRVAEPDSPQRLPRRLDLALPLATRPTSWRLLAQSTRETLTLLASLDAREAAAPQDVRIVADLPGTITALAHLTHVALGHGITSRAGTFRNVPRLIGEVVLADSKVETIHPDKVTLNFHGRFGAAALSLSGEAVEAGQIVLADDAAIIDHLPEPQRPSMLRLVAMTATSTIPAKRLAAPIMLYPDRGVTLVQRPDQAILALVSGPAEIEARLASTLQGPFPLQRTATAHFRKLATTDGAPVIGRITPSRLFAIAGLGDAAAFLAPPLARVLVGEGTAGEKSWFAAHAPARPRDTIADFVSAAAA